MKHLIVMTIFICSNLLNSNLAVAQTPQSIPYQAVARDTNGNLIANQSVSLRFSIHQAAPNGNVVYKEVQSGITNALGLLNVNIGQGAPIVGTLAGINWSNGSKFIQVEMDATGGSVYVDMGTTQLMSVPYALFANKCGDLPTGTGIGNTMHWNGTVWVADNGVYNDGSKVGIGAANGTPWKLQVTGADSAIKISGIGPIQQYGQLNFGDANYVYLREDEDDKLMINASRLSLNGGNVGINTTNPVARLHVENDDVVFTGPASLPANPPNPPIQGAGSRMMWYPGKAAFRAGMVDGSDWDKANIGNYSFAAGNNAIATGESAVAIGDGAVATGDHAVAFGDYTHAHGSHSNALGYFAFAEGNYSTAIGQEVVTDAFCTFAVGRYNDPFNYSATNISSATPLFIVGNGEYAARSNAFIVRNNTRVGIGTDANTYQLELSQNSAAKPSSSSWTISSDARLKDIDGNYTKGLSEILKLNTILYHYKKGNARKLPTDETSYGFIAQEVQKIFPECVKENEDGYLSLDMHPILVSYVNAFKELNEKSETLNMKYNEVLHANEEQEKQNARLQKQIDELKLLIKK